MKNARTGILVTAAASGSALLVIALILNFLVVGSMDIRDIETSEHADEIVRASEPAGDMGEQVLNLNGYWKKPTVTVAFFPVGLTESQYAEIAAELRGAVQVANASATNSTHISYSRWPDLLAGLKTESKNVPYMQLIEADRENADIKVFMEAEPHPANKVGSAKILRDKATLEIAYAEVHIYSTYDLHRDGILESVLKHELGHALGVGHSTAEVSIMHSPIVIADGTVLGGIGQCEAEAVSSLYLDRNVREIVC